MFSYNFKRDYKAPSVALETKAVSMCLPRGIYHAQLIIVVFRAVSSFRQLTPCPPKRNPLVLGGRQTPEESFDKTPRRKGKGSGYLLIGRDNVHDENVMKKKPSAMPRRGKKGTPTERQIDKKSADCPTAGRKQRLPRTAKC